MISGINIGANLGKNLIYSGKISAAYEGAILDIPSAAISLDSFKVKSFTGAKYVATSIANYLLQHKLPKGTLLVALLHKFKAKVPAGDDTIITDDRLIVITGKTEKKTVLKKLLG